jgi:hypothetical protein
LASQVQIARKLNRKQQKQQSDQSHTLFAPHSSVPVFSASAFVNSVPFQDSSFGLSLPTIQCLWFELVKRVREHWEGATDIPHVPRKHADSGDDDEHSDFSPNQKNPVDQISYTTCLLHQKLQLINYCISRQQNFSPDRDSSNSSVTTAQRGDSQSVRKDEFFDALLDAPTSAPKLNMSSVDTHSTRPMSSSPLSHFAHSLGSILGAGAKATVAALNKQKLQSPTKATSSVVSSPAPVNTNLVPPIQLPNLHSPTSPSSPKSDEDVFYDAEEASPSTPQSAALSIAQASESANMNEDSELDRQAEGRLRVIPNLFLLNYPHRLVHVPITQVFSQLISL